MVSGEKETATVETYPDGRERGTFRRDLGGGTEPDQRGDGFPLTDGRWQNSCGIWKQAEQIYYIMKKAATAIS